jgi:CheY-like chemotaxis protein
MKSFPSTDHTLHEGTRFRANAAEDRSPKIERHALTPREAIPTIKNYVPSTTSHKQILVVDDDAAIRDVLANFLRRSGYQVSCANDGEAGWEALCANRFNALITDHAMPRLTGLDLLRRVRSGPLKELPTILISGEMPSGERDLLELVWPGVAMEKPFSLLELLTSVRGVLTMSVHAEPVYAA